MVALGGRSGGRFVSRAFGFGGRGSGRGQLQMGDDADAAAIAEAEDTMRGMTGNPGQDAVLDEAMGAFIEWAERAVEFQQGAGEFPEVLGLREDKYNGTSEIWETGYDIISEVSGFHDSEDEKGEGQGQEF